MKVNYLLENLAFSAWPDTKTIKQHNIQTLITVCKKKPEPELITSVKEHLYIPLTDGKDMPIDLEMAIEATINAYNSGKRVLVHCYLGRNRSVLVAALAYRRIVNCSYKEAFEAVKILKSSALYNKTFEEHFL